MRLALVLLLALPLAACGDDAPGGDSGSRDSTAVSVIPERPGSRPGRTALTGTWDVAQGAGRTFHAEEQLQFETNGRLIVRPHPRRGLGPGGNEVELAYAVERDTLVIADAWGRERFVIEEDEDEGTVALTLAGTDETARLEPPLGE